MPTSFSNAVTFATGSLPTSVSIADLNGDGKADLAVANSGSNTVSVMLGNGDGTFRTLENDATGTKPVFVSIADVNNDGEKDLLAVMWNTTANPPNVSGGLSVLLGVGDGTFRPQIQNYASGSAPEALAINDFNRDGKLDVAITANMEGFISYGVGKGDGTFGFGMVLPAGSGPWGIASEDFNRDGNPDLVVANSNSNNVSVLLGSGNFSFSAQTYATGVAPTAVVIADFNGDGKTDLAVTDLSSTNNVSILIGKGDGSFKAQSAYTVGITPYSIAIADFNVDGKADIVTASNGSNILSIMLGNGDGTFQAETLITSADRNSSVAVADVNGDGKADIVTTNSRNDTISVFLNTSKSAPTFTSASTAAVAENVSTTTTAYIAKAVSADGAAQLMYSISGGADASLFNINTSTGAVTFKASPNYEAPNDFGGNNVYDIILQASDGLQTSGQAVSISLTNVNEPPVIISAGAVSTLEQISSSTAVYIVLASDPDAGSTISYKISGGADASLFNINSSTGAVTFKSSPCFGMPSDAGSNNIYDIIVQASDGVATAVKTVTIDVLNNGNLPVPSKQWTKLIGTTGSDSAYAITIGPDGSIYVGGHVSGSLDGQPYAGGNADSVLVKLNPDGSKAWTRLLGGAGSDATLAITTGRDGAIYVGGYTTANLDGQTNNGIDDGFISKFNSDGARAWTKLIGTPGLDYVNALTTGADGALYVAGRTTGSLDGQTNIGSDQSFLIKFNPDGSKVWSQFLGATGSTIASELSTGLDGSIYIAGYTNINIDGQLNNGSYDSFITKYNADGNKAWTKLLGTTGTEYPSGLITGADGAIYISGYTSGNLSGEANTSGTASFLTKYYPDGSRVWTKLVVSQGYITSSALSTGVDGAIYVDGYASGNLDEQINSGGDDAFLIKFNPDGSKVWTKLLGSAGTDQATALTTGIDGAIYLTGLTSASFDGQSFNGGTFDAFVTKFSASAPNILSPATISVSENVPITTPVYTALATDPDVGTVITYYLSGGIDAARFNINPTTGAVTFKLSPDFEAPTDSGANNVYDIMVRASDGSLYADKAVSIIVTDVKEALANASVHGASYFWKSNTSGQHALLSGVNVTALGGAPSAEGANAPIQIKNVVRDVAGHVTADVFAHVISSMDAFDLNLDVGGGSNVTFTSTLDATSWPVYWSASGSSVLASGFSMTAASAGDIKLGTLSFDAGASSATHIAIKSGTDIALNNIATYAAPFSYVSAQGVTGADGGYSVSALDPGSYALTASRSTNDIGNAISSSDALAALKLSVALNPNATVNGSQAPVSPFQYMAADINGDGRITSSDALSILKMAVHLNGAATPEWMFVEETRDLSGISRTSAAWDHNISANVQGDTTANLAGFIKGDVNGSWTPPAGTQYVETSDPTHFTNLNSVFHIPLSEWAIA